ncbi:MAG: hypothetical protein IBX55_12765 [Methyloprofundus sp.]|nr:hypothetical protein [Methyloprofundus sp.]
MGDNTAKIPVQLTSKNMFSKIEKTVVKFNDKNLYETYDQLKIVIIGVKKGNQKKNIEDSSKDVWDIPRLVELIGDKSVGCTMKLPPKLWVYL